MSKVFYATVAVAALLALPFNQAAAQDSKSKLDEVLARGHLVVGTGSTNAPWHFKGADDTLQGFDIDMGHIIAKALFSDPNKVEFVNQSSDARIPNITTNKVDITCQFMTVTGERAQQIAFTIPYYREGVGLMLKADSKYADYAALKAAGSAVTISVLQNVYAEITFIENTNQWNGSTSMEIVNLGKTWLSRNCRKAFLQPSLRCPLTYNCFGNFRVASEQR